MKETIQISQTTKIKIFVNPVQTTYFYNKKTINW